MRFHRALGNIQIPSDFRVVASLKQQLNDLPLSRPYLIQLFFHKHAPDRRLPLAASGSPTRSGLHLDFLFASHFAFTGPNSVVRVN